MSSAMILKDQQKNGVDWLEEGQEWGGFKKEKDKKN